MKEGIHKKHQAQSPDSGIRIPAGGINTNEYTDAIVW